MIGQNILLANIGWSPSYAGEPVLGAMGYIVENGTGGEAYNFRPSSDGLFHGYARGVLDAHSARLWTVIFVSKPEGSIGLRVVGWYEDAVVGAYAVHPEYAYDPYFPVIPGNGERFVCNVTAGKAFFVPPEDREHLFVPKGHPIKTGGVYFASGHGSDKDSTAQRALRKRIADWARRELPRYRAQSRVARPTAVKPMQLPGLELDDGGKPHGYSPVAESDEHRALRLWAMENPVEVTGRRGRFHSDTEALLLSGDWVDVVQTLADEQWVIEVKSRRSSDEDHRRGVYQCVKYRAVAVAMRDDALPTVHAVLVTERPLTAALDAERRALGVDHLLAPMDRV